MINIDSIMKKTKKFSKTKQGVEKVKTLREKAFDQNKTFGKRKVAGEGIICKEDYITASKKYLDLLINFARTDPRVSEGLRGIIEDVAFLNNTVSQPQKAGKGLYKVGIEFNKASLRRNSLLAEKRGGSYYTGEGIENILALFNNGMDIHAKTVPIGLWESHGIVVRATTHRDALKFMQSTTQEFLDLYRRKYEVKSLDIDEIYKQ